MDANRSIVKNTELDDALLEAIRERKASAVIILLGLGANANAQEAEQYRRHEKTALMLAVQPRRDFSVKHWKMKPEAPKIVQALLERGANVNAKTFGGVPVLFFALNDEYCKTGIQTRPTLRKSAI